MAEDVPVECQAGILNVGTCWDAQAIMFLLTRSLIQLWTIRAGKTMGKLPCWHGLVRGKLLWMGIPAGGCHQSGCGPLAAPGSPPVLLATYDETFT